MTAKDECEVAEMMRDLTNRGLADKFRTFAMAVGSTLEEVLSKKGGRGEEHLARARGAMYAYVRDTHQWSYAYIGKVFHRDHTTVLATLKRWRAWVAVKEASRLKLPARHKKSKGA